MNEQATKEQPKEQVEKERPSAIKVFFVDGTYYEYTVRDFQMAKKYAHSIITTGFRRPEADGSKTYFPVAEIKKVVVRELPEGSGAVFGRSNRIDEKKK